MHGRAESTSTRRHGLTPLPSSLMMKFDPRGMIIFQLQTVEKIVMRKNKRKRRFFLSFLMREIFSKFTCLVQAMQCWKKVNSPTGARFVLRPLFTLWHFHYFLRSELSLKRASFSVCEKREMAFSLFFRLPVKMCVRNANVEENDFRNVNLPRLKTTVLMLVWNESKKNGSHLRHLFCWKIHQIYSITITAKNY